jgi:hypothetical protein
MKKGMFTIMKDYSYLRGFNYTQGNASTDTVFWEEYDHDTVDREMGYAERLGLNSARVFLTYSSYVRIRRFPFKCQGFCSDGMEARDIHQPDNLSWLPFSPGGL